MLEELYKPLDLLFRSFNAQLIDFLSLAVLGFGYVCSLFLPKQQNFASYLNSNFTENRSFSSLVRSKSFYHQFVLFPQLPENLCLFNFLPFDLLAGGYSFLQRSLPHFSVQSLI